MRRFVLAAVLTTVSFSASAEWVEFFSDNESKTYLDPRQAMFDKTSVTILSLIDYPQPRRISGNLYLSFISKIEFDCVNERARFIGAYSYSGNMSTGKVVSVDNSSKDWERVVPNSHLSNARTMLCLAAKKEQQ